MRTQTRPCIPLPAAAGPTFPPRQQQTSAIRNQGRHELLVQPERLLCHHVAARVDVCVVAGETMGSDMDESRAACRGQARFSLPLLSSVGRVPFSDFLLEHPPFRLYAFPLLGVRMPEEGAAQAPLGTVPALGRQEGNEKNVVDELSQVGFVPFIFSKLLETHRWETDRFAQCARLGVDADGLDPDAQLGELLNLAVSLDPEKFADKTGGACFT